MIAHKRRSLRTFTASVASENKMPAGRTIVKNLWRWKSRKFHHKFSLRCQQKCQLGLWIWYWSAKLRLCCWAENLYLLFVALYIIKIFPISHFFIHKLAQNDKVKRKKCQAKWRSRGLIPAACNIILRHEITPLALCSLSIRCSLLRVMHFRGRNSLDLVSRQKSNYMKESRDIAGTCYKIARGQFVTYAAQRDPHDIVSHRYDFSSPIDYKCYAALHGFASADIEEDIDIDNGAAR